MGRLTKYMSDTSVIVGHQRWLDPLSVGRGVLYENRLGVDIHNLGPPALYCKACVAGLT
jgi:hypothetical protein